MAGNIGVGQQQLHAGMTGGAYRSGCTLSIAGIWGDLCQFAQRICA
jgi:hypothetical protein